mgnify:CR=1 FL=1
MASGLLSKCDCFCVYYDFPDCLVRSGRECRLNERREDPGGGAVKKTSEFSGGFSLQRFFGRGFVVVLPLRLFESGQYIAENLGLQCRTPENNILGRNPFSSIQVQPRVIFDGTLGRAYRSLWDLIRPDAIQASARHLNSKKIAPVVRSQDKAGARVFYRRRLFTRIPRNDHVTWAKRSHRVLLA